jgi:hypothetical protein
METLNKSLRSWAFIAKSPGIQRVIGWHISIYRIDDDRSTEDSSVPIDRIAVWQAGGSGLDWIAELVRSGNAISRGGNGYPYRFIARTRHIEPVLKAGPPSARDVWLHDQGDVLLPGYEGKSTIRFDVLDQCNRD